MTLVDIVQSLSDWPEEMTIYVAEPWKPDAAASILMESDAGGLPPEAIEMALSYFIEVHIANEFLAGWRLDKPWNATAATERLIQYAIHDA
jgi:hypothetical protein